ncbi:MAG TPA: acetate--CoA ligase family protein [archaeon]|nr:acetate--CoA ligase family protein [archaeon]
MQKIIKTKNTNYLAFFLDSLHKMFDPKTICVIGASSRQNSVGFSLMKNLAGTDYRGTVYPVNPKRRSVLGIRCYKGILDLPEKIDLAIIATPSFTVPDIVRECVKADAKSIIVLSSGFGETGKKGMLLEQELKKIISGTGIRMLGPNCLGYIRTDKKVNASFAIRNALPGRMALISQSGALCSSILDWALKQHVGFKYFISIGSMADIDFSDLIDFIGKDPEVESIAIYMETIKDARRFMKAASNFAKTKPIIVAKSGKFEESAKAAVSHTGSMAGNDAVFDAAFQRAGIVRVENILDLLGCSEALAKQPLPRGNRLAIITNAGGPGVMAVDAAIMQGSKISVLSKKAFSSLEKTMPANWSHSNPIDLLGDADAERYANALDAVLKENSVDGAVIIFSPQAVSNPEAVAEIVSAKARHSKKTILACWMGESFVEPAREILRRHSIPCYKTPEEAVRVFGYMDSYRENKKWLFETPSAKEFLPNPSRKKIREKISEYIAKKTLVLNELDSKQILSEYGIPVNKTLFAKNAKQAVSKSLQIGFPVALKVVSSSITHKTDANAVALNLASKKEVAKAFSEIIRNAKKSAPNAKILGVTVQEMIPPGNLELIIGSKTDNIFGPVILFGFGGISTEIFRDTSIGLPPLTQNLAKRMIAGTRVSRLLYGERKKFKINVSELEKILIGFSHFAVDFPEVEEIDINPIMVSNNRLFAVDARIVLSEKVLRKEKNFVGLAISPKAE